MKRRSFLKNIGSFGAAGLISPVLPLMPKKAFADHFPQLQFRNVAAANLPRYINVFLYGGPSELAGNLSNIEDINANSQNPYPNNLNPNDANTLVTANNLWSTAGGTIMEQMLASGDLSIYRTMNRRKDNNRAHGISVIQNLVGNLDVDTPGIATTLAWIIENNNPFGKAVDELLFPFITFEGESRAFKRVGHEVPVALKPLALNPNLSANVFNPYQRSNQTRAGLANGGARDLALEALALQTNEAVGLQMLGDGFIQRALYADRVDALFAAADIANAVTTYGYGDGNFGR
ncbi:MAG: hypothetical protein OEZ58_15105, partial [Gammaproteobacteria bacterium]|nr:hypothetical protein [Gammaproteobacteria bacterium]